MAQRYGVLPTELIHMSVWDLNWNIMICEIGAEKEETKRKMRDLERRARKGNRRQQR